MQSKFVLGKNLSPGCVDLRYESYDHRVPLTIPQPTPSGGQLFYAKKAIFCIRDDIFRVNPRPLTAFPSLPPVSAYTSVHCQCPTMTCFDKSNWNPLYKLPAIASGGVSERASVNGETIRMHIYHRNSAASGPTERSESRPPRRRRPIIQSNLSRRRRPVLYHTL